MFTLLSVGYVYTPLWTFGIIIGKVNIGRRHQIYGFFD